MNYQNWVNERTVKVLGPREHYAASTQLVLRQAWHNDEVTLAVRRVRLERAVADEVQLEITLKTFHNKRTSQMHASLVLPPDLADKLVEAIQTRQK
jgi:hypothetical protein